MDVDVDVDVDVNVVLIYYSHDPPFSSGRFSSRPRQGFPPREEPSSDPSIIYRLSSSPDPHDSDGDREGMRTRRGFFYGACEGVCSDVGAAVVVKKSTRQRREEETGFAGCKRQRRAADRFDALPDDLVLSILSKLSATARRPSDFISVLLTCKRLKVLGLNSQVLSMASAKTFAIKAKNWSDSTHRFLKLCAESGNLEASFTLGMIRFYCLQSRGSGASLMAKAAIGCHAPAMYSLAVIQFNGSGGSKNDKDLRAGVALCARAAFLGHVDAMRELGHCLQDGYGVRQNIAEGRRFLVQANARELAAVLSTSSAAAFLSARSWLAWGLHSVSGHRHLVGGGCPLLSDFGCNVPPSEAHPANRFLAEWFSARGGSPGPGLRMCSHVGCGRPETRRHEFRRCSVCGTVNYCSRACQALDWKLRHKTECVALGRWVADGADHGRENVGAGDGGDPDVVLES